MKKLLEKMRNLRCREGCRDFVRHYLGGLYHRVAEHHAFLLAGGLAFSLFISIVPLVLIVFSVLGSILERPSIAEEINTFIDRMVPYQDYARFVKELVFSRVDEFRQFKNVAGVIGIFGLLFASSILFSSMRTILDKIFRIRDDVSILMGKLRDIGLILLVLVYFVISTTLLSLWEVIKELADRVELLHSLRFGSLEDFTMGVVSFVIIFMAFMILYFAVPYTRPPKRTVFVSALSATILWELAKQLFGFYITHFVMLQRVYGAYALMVVVAFWIYYTSVVFVIGAEIGQLFRERLALKPSRKKDRKKRVSSE
ncbi:MAG: YihY/virulence factor BrkB family protein [candidate division Zixibacteria bacterium]